MVVSRVGRFGALNGTCSTCKMENTGVLADFLKERGENEKNRQVISLPVHLLGFVFQWLLAQ
ncbi:MAG: hypothetical protein D6675_10140 [Gemmatimonadetes bacterium]|nr:MAG: hypothetical protein D6675_10140 [Gemmatimonadota bacterium]